MMFKEYDLELNNFNSYFLKYFNNNLEKDLLLSVGEFANVLDYSIEEGKRLRPLILLRTYEMLAKNKADNIVKNYAVALELIHNYSLIHDDLPSMDNDDYRRGRLTTHKKFNEANAILAGDALLNYAYQLLFKQLTENPNLNYIKAAREIADNAGIKGMIGGQVLDVDNEELDLKDIILMYEYKTCALFASACASAAYLADLSDEKVDDLRKLGIYIGMAFQIQDDLLDFDRDEDLGKKTYIAFVGKEKAYSDMLSYTDKALEILANYDDNLFLTKLIKFLINRNI